MNRNSNSRFAQAPQVDIQRSTFDRSSGNKTTFNAGKLVPIYIDEVLPGDTFEMSTSAVIRGSTPIFPVMDNANLDIYFFFVPNRLVWEHWKEFNGENTTSKWEQTTEYTIPQLVPPLANPGTVPSKPAGWEKGTLADYMGIPTLVGPGASQTNPEYSVNALPFRAYCLIWNEWFRDQNLQDPVFINKGDARALGAHLPAETETTINKHQTAMAGAYVLPVNKYFDYFTGALPEPQKGPDVLLPLGQMAPVVTGNRANTTINNNPVTFSSNSFTEVGKMHNLGIQVTGEKAGKLAVDTSATTTLAPQTAIPNNLQADLSNATSATINELRLAFQLQRLYERDARGGTRYIEILKAHFGVTSPDARLQRPEYLGGERIPINIDQVIQTSASAEGTTPQGNTGAYSLTGNQGSYFKHSFVEHGYILGLACVRTEHTYQQGLEKLWNRTKRFDFYWPALANIGEQAILNKEIYLDANKTENEKAFGYQEAWAEYRYKPSRVSGAFRSNITNGSLDAWHYADYYDSQPYLSEDWIQETSANVDRTLAVQSELEDQYIADFWFKCTCTRPMPIYSIPGLIDHH